MSVATYTKSGSKATTPAKLDALVFGLEVTNHELIKQAYLAYLANGRQNNAVTKTRGLVRGGGKKPWKQKGTGRARFGSSRVPIWRGGGITFGPTGEENYKHKISTQAKRTAIRQTLSMAASENKISVIESITLANNKTKDVQALLNKLGANRQVLVVVDSKDEVLSRAFRNISDVKLITAKYINAYDIVNAHTIVITKAALPIISQWLGQSKDSKAVVADKEAK